MLDLLVKVPIRPPLRQSSTDQWKSKQSVKLLRWCLVLRARFLMENKVARTFVRRADFDQWGLREGCPGCWFSRTGQGRQQTHSEACWRRMEGLLNGDLPRSARLAAGHERLSRALAEAVERNATKGPGMRDIPKWASVVGHPEPQKNIALDTEQDSTPHRTVQSPTEDHQHQVRNPASPQALTRTPARAT